MPSQYWLISLPLSGSKEEKWKSLSEKIGKVAFDTPVYKLHIPELRVGTLDSLLALSDDLVKTNSFIEGVTQKLARQIDDLDKVIEGGASILGVDGVPIDSYITRFTWDEAKYPIMTPLRETVDTIHESVAKLEDDLKVRVSEYNTVKSQLSSITRKAGGSMAVRDLSDVVKEEDIVSNSEHLTTLLIIVSKFAEKDWLSTYETLSPMVVPRSSKRISEDNEYVLFTVTLFRKVADTFKVAARDKGFQVRDYVHDPEGLKQRQEDQERLTQDQENMRATLHHWCETSYGEVFSSWTHICCIRLFTESILRYGLPPAYLAAVLAPPQKQEKRVRAALESLAGVNSGFWKGDSDAGMAGLTGGDSEMHPYVSFTMNLA